MGKMQKDYDFVLKFIRNFLLSGQIPFAEGPRYIPHTKVFADEFSSSGWEVEGPEDGQKHSKMRFTSPDRKIEVNLSGSAIGRYPKETPMIATRKELTKKFLNAKGVASPAGADFAQSEKRIAQLFF